MSNSKPAEDCVDCAPSTQPVVPKSPAAAPNQDLLNPSSFSPPVLSVGQEGEELPRVVIEFCDRCRWLHRAVWTQTEVRLTWTDTPPCEADDDAAYTTVQLFLTFPPTTTTSEDGVATSSGIKAITLLPRSAPETGGRFRVWLYRYRTLEQEFEESKGKEKWDGAELIWDRKIEGGFPELKDLVSAFDRGTCYSPSLSVLLTVASQKQRIRNYIAPKQDLGHSDSKEKKEASPPEDVKPKDEQVPSYEPTFRC